MPRRLVGPATAAVIGAALVGLLSVTTAARWTAADPGAARHVAADAAPTTVNAFMSYTAATKTVTLTLIAAYNTVQGGFNFNGGSQGSQTITVPAGWTVNAAVLNKDAIPHSAIIIADQKPLPNTPDKPAIQRAYTAHLTDGLAPLTGKDTMNFTAAPAGSYFIACGVSGHAVSGMYIRFVVSATVAVPSYTM
jgi:sulfocyanin